ncbi:MAG: hypothetical protein ACTHKF_10025 [Candidatus Nitrosocosmicus sp.]
MKTITLFAIILISVYIGSFAAITSKQSLTMTIFAKSDKCINIQSPDAPTLTDCAAAKSNPLFSAEFKKECRELGGKCSSSQTGFGTYGNFVKQNK